MWDTTSVSAISTPASGIVTAILPVASKPIGTATTVGAQRWGYRFDQYDKSTIIVATGLDVRDYSNVQHTVSRPLFHGFAAFVGRGAHA